MASTENTQDMIVKMLKRTKRVTSIIVATAMCFVTKSRKTSKCLLLATLVMVLVVWFQHRNIEKLKLSTLTWRSRIPQPMNDNAEKYATKSNTSSNNGNNNNNNNDNNDNTASNNSNDGYNNNNTENHNNNDSNNGKDKTNSIECKPVRNIAFIKTHKAGSSTVTVMLHRYGITHNLTFALPNKPFRSDGYNYILSPGQSLTKDKIYPIKQGQAYNILCHHSYYNRESYRATLPSNTTHITILREPFSQFVSAFEFYDGRHRLHVDPGHENPESTFLSDFERYEPRHFSLFRNSQAFDLGLVGIDYSNSEKLKEYIHQIEVDFKVVIIVERLNECLVLLKRELCLDTKDILYISANVNKNKPVRNFTSTDYENHKKASHLDYVLYNHFTELLNKKLAAFQNDFSEEVRHFEQLLPKVFDNCQREEPFHVEPSRWNEAFDVTAKECRLMKAHVLDGLNHLFAKAGVAEAAGYELV